MKKLLLLCAVAYLQMGGCATTSNFQAVASSELTNMAVTAVAKHYGGDKAGELASAGLYAAADVLQGYVNKEPPMDIVTKSPGVKGVGSALSSWLVDRGTVKQETINNIHKAAELAAGMTEVKK